MQNICRRVCVFVAKNLTILQPYFDDQSVPKPIGCFS